MTDRSASAPLRRALLAWGPPLVPAAFLAAFFVWPLAAIIGRGLSAATLAALAEQPRLGQVVWFTLWQAAASTAITVVLGVGGAWTLARYRLRGARLIRALIMVPFVLPTVVVASAFIALLGPRGPLAGLGLQPSVAAVLAAHVFFNYAVVVRTVAVVLDRLDPRLEEAARVLGASPLRAAREVTFPLLRPALGAASSIVFLFTFTSFGVVLILGGPRRATLEVEIWRQTAQLLDLRVAAGLALLQLGCVVAVLTIHGRLARRAALPLTPRPASEVARPVRTPLDALFVGANLVVAAALLVTPVAAMVLRSFRVGDEWTITAYRTLGTTSASSALFVAPVEAAANSIVFAVVATALAVAVGGSAAVALHRRRSAGGRLLDTVLMLPLGTSAVTLGFGFLITLDRPPLDLRASAVLVPIAHALVGLPFVVRTVLPALDGIPPRLRQAATVLGAGPVRARWEVDVPIVSRAAVAGAALAFAVSLGEFGATLFIARPDRPTLPIAIFRLLSQPGPLNGAQALALATVLMAVTATATSAIERLRVGSPGFF